MKSRDHLNSFKADVNMVVIKAAFVLVFTLFSSHYALAVDQQCSELYTKEKLIGAGVRKKVYLINPQSAKDGKCWDSGCPEVVVKEATARMQTPEVEKIKTLAVKLNVALPIYARGTCIDAGNTINYLIEKLGIPVDKSKIREHPDYFAGKIQRRLDTLHKNNIIHGDPHIGNILVDKDNQVYLADFDESIMVAGNEKSGRVAFENFYASAIWVAREDWQPLFYRYKSFDLNQDGQITGAELDKLAGAMGSWDAASDIAVIYKDEMALLPSDVKAGLFLDIYNQGDVRPKAVEEGKISQAKLLAYRNQVQTWKQNYNIIPRRPMNDPQHLVDNRGSYKNWPLYREHILLISGGDVNEKRTYPLLTRENFKILAQERSYKFQHYSGNLASPFVGYWHKIYMILDKMNVPENRVIVWLDDDGVVDVKSDFIEKVLKNYPNADLIMASDPEEHAYLNSGFMIVRNTYNSLAILRRILDLGAMGRADSDDPVENWFAKNHLRRCVQEYNCLHEQQALKELYLGNYLDSRGEHPLANPLPKQLKDKILVIPQIGELEAHPYQVNLLLKNGAYTPLSGKNANGSLETLSPDQYGLRAQQRLQLPFFVQCASQGSDKAECVNSLLKLSSASSGSEDTFSASGDFHEKCLDCKEANGFLTCTCPDTLGAWQPTWAAASCPGGELNLSSGGILRCTTPQPKSCSSLYTIESVLKSNAIGITARGTDKEGNKRTIKEFSFGRKSIDPSLDTVSMLGWRDQIVDSGTCQKDDEAVYYRIQSEPQSLETTRFDEPAIKALINKIAAHGLSVRSLTPNDLGLASNGSLIMTNFEDLYPEDKSLDAQRIERQTLVRISHLWQEVAPWQTFPYKYKSFDHDRSGDIDGDEFKILQASVGGEGSARAIQFLYQHRMKHLGLMSPSDRDDVLNDCDNSGFLTNPWQQFVKIAVTVGLKGQAAQKYRYAEQLCSRTFSYDSKSFHIITSKGAYKDRPLQSNQVLIISGGDLTAKRNFPIYTRENQSQFARNKQYNFQHHAGNLAANYVGYWHKIYMIMDALTNPSNRVVVWFDDDGVVDANSDMLDRYIQQFPDANMVIARDPEDFAYINSGALIVRNSERTWQLLADIIRIGEGNSNHLMKCSQAADCLHEQQAIQMLLEGKVASASGIKWSKYIAVVPQYDSKTGLNLNFLLKSGVTGGFRLQTEAGAVDYSNISDFRSKTGGWLKSGSLPFFAQCADKSQNKNICVRSLLEVYQPDFMKTSPSAPPSGSYLSSCECLKVGNKIDCDCNGSAASLDLPCKLGSIELWNKGLVCVGRDKFPEGNYANSCSDCYRSEDKLHCKCSGGTSSQASVNIPCASGQIVENINGHLMCLFPQKKLPEGEYNKDNCEFRGDQLICPRSTLQLPCESGKVIENDSKGNLICIDAKKKIPEGSFRSSCDSCLYRANTMSCRCDGKQTSVNLPCENGKFIENILGTLKCLYPKKPIPSGDYQSNFAECELRGDTLTCNNQKDSQSLTFPCAKGEEVVYQDKKLQCLPKKKPLPSGYYLKRSNSACEIRTDMLRCSRNQKQSKIKVPCDDGFTLDFDKSDALVCADIIKTMPPGSYTSSCSKCSAEKGFLKCECESPGNKRIMTTLPLPCSDVDNVNGNLVCVKKEKPAHDL